MFLSYNFSFFCFSFQVGLQFYDQEQLSRFKLTDNKGINLVYR